MGIFGLEFLEQSRRVFVGFWRLPVFEWVVVTCLVLHFLAVLYRLFNKKTFRGLNAFEWVQIVLGFIIPDLMVFHILETKIANKLFGTLDTYTHLLYWTPPYFMIMFLLLLVVVWTHGTLGIRNYIKQKPWYPAWQPWLLGFAVLLPTFAAWGIVNASNEVDRLALDQAWVDQMLAENNPDQVDLLAWELGWDAEFAGSYLLFIILFFVARKIVRELKKKHSGIVVRYLEGTEITVPRGTTLLEASLMAEIPHAHVCGGRGRCSTCRVEVIEGLENLPPPSVDERELLQRIKCGNAVRLACRTQPVTGCTIYPLLLPNVSLKQSLWKKTDYSGVDRDVAVLFTDLRGFTAFAEDKLPYDVVFVLNQYFQFMGHAVEAHHGRIDKFIGDAIMAVFGVDRNLRDACRDALAAARSMRFQLDRLNSQLKNELDRPLEMGFGIHCGHVIIGEMGYNENNNLVAIGDATNTASRLESLTKEFDCELVVSADVIRNAELDFSPHLKRSVNIRGRQRSMDVFAVKEVRLIEV